jgi:hypothetical protein
MIVVDMFLVASDGEVYFETALVGLSEKKAFHGSFYSLMGCIRGSEALETDSEPGLNTAVQLGKTIVGVWSKWLFIAAMWQKSLNLQSVSCAFR